MGSEVCSNRDFWPFVPANLTRWPVTHKHDPFSLQYMPDVQIWSSTSSKYVNYIKALHSYCLTSIQTRPKLNIIPSHGMSKTEQTGKWECCFSGTSSTDLSLASQIRRMVPAAATDCRKNCHRRPCGVCPSGTPCTCNTRPSLYAKKAAVWCHHVGSLAHALGARQHDSQHSSWWTAQHTWCHQMTRHECCSICPQISSPLVLGPRSCTTSANLSADLD